MGFEPWPKVTFLNDEPKLLHGLSIGVQEELFAIPIVGWIMASHGGVPINRRNRASAVQASQEYCVATSWT